jgi:uncharacterized protein
LTGGVAICDLRASRAGDLRSGRIAEPADPRDRGIVVACCVGVRVSEKARAGSLAPGIARPGDELHVDLPVRPRWTYPAAHVDAVRGCVAVERGPLVYCAESPAADTSAEDLSTLRVDDSSAPTDRSDGTVRVGERPLDLIPYHRWGNRGPATMRVWLPLAARRRP